MKVKLYILTFFVFSQLSSIGQNACYTTIDTVGTVPHTVNLTHCGDDSKPTLYDYGDGSSLTPSTTHTYTEQGYYTIIQLVSNNPEIDTFKIDSVIRVVNSPIPIFRAFTCINNEVKVICEDLGYDKYIVNYGDGSNNDTTEAKIEVFHTYLDTLPKVITVTGLYSFTTGGSFNTSEIQPYTSLITPRTVELINIENQRIQLKMDGYNHLNYYYNLNENNNLITSDSFTLSNSDTSILLTQSINNSINITTSAFDYCGNFLDETTYSSIILSVLAENGKNIIDWSTLQTQVDTFVLSRNNEVIDTLSSDISTYEDTNVLCGKEYCYRVKALHENNYNSNFSNENCVTSINNITPPPLDSLSSSFRLDNQLEILFKNTNNIEVSRYIIQDIHDNKVELITSSSSDITLEHQNGHCYNIYYFDICENKSNLSQDTTCPIELTIINEDFNYELNYTSYKSFKSDLKEYSIEWLKTDFSKILEITNNNELEYIDETPYEKTQKFYYRIKATPNNTNEAISYSKIELVEQYPLMLFPNAFTPNNDGINDSFISKSNFIKSYQLSIFNAWGKIIFKTDDPNIGWNGTLEGKDQPLGNYQYQVIYEDSLGEKHQKSGTIKLIR